jgi:putative endonuclease
MVKNSFVYILSNDKKNAFHVDVTNDLKRRLELHANNPKGMVKDRQVVNLVLVETKENIKLAIDRQKEIKSLSAEDKIKLVSADNPDWKSMNKDFLK